MQLCNDGHETVCHASDTCPACYFKNQIQTSDEEASAALAEVDELRGTIDDLRSKLVEVK